MKREAGSAVLGMLLAAGGWAQTPPAPTPPPAEQAPLPTEKAGPMPAQVTFGPPLPAQPCPPPENCLNRPIWLPCDPANPTKLNIPPAGIWDPFLPAPLPPLTQVTDQLPASPSAVPELPQRDALELRAVLESVERQFPLLYAISQERDIAAGQRIAAEGAFDLNLRGGSSVFPDGNSYPQRRVTLGLEQNTTLYGLSYFAGYRYGSGDFPSYQGGVQTGDGGEFRAGLVLPLLKGGPIDRQRATLRQAQIAQDIAEPTIQQARIAFLRAAARAYWTWVARGEQVKVAARVLQIAQRRQQILDRRLEAGATDLPTVTDNRRIVAQRERIYIAADREFQRAAFELSLYLRDPAGQPLVPEASQLPRNFMAVVPAKPDASQMKADLDLAFSLRPELLRFPLLRERASVELRLAENLAFPGVNFAMAGARDIGYTKEGLDKATWDISLFVDVPLQRREATGRAAAARATLLQLSAQETYARDQIVAEVQNAVSELDRAYQRIVQARREREEALAVLDQSTRRFDAGRDDLFVLNIREQQAAEAEFAVVDTLADYFRAVADYRAALGLDGLPRDR